MSTVRDQINQFEKENPSNGICLVLGNSKKGKIRQINKIAKERWGNDVGYSAEFLKNMGCGVEIWIIERSSNI